MDSGNLKLHAHLQQCLELACRGEGRVCCGRDLYGNIGVHGNLCSCIELRKGWS